VGYLLHRPIETVCAVPSEERNGFTDFRRPTVDWLDRAVTLTRHGRRWLWDCTAIALAGTLTQTYRYPDTPDGSAAPDFRRAEEMSLRACRDDMDCAIAYGRKARDRVTEYLAQDRYWTLVDALVGTLINVGTLSGHQARQVMNEADYSSSA
jgi:hypothetical protein